jgi:hypothetical protein
MLMGRRTKEETIIQNVDMTWEPECVEVAGKVLRVGVGGVSKITVHTVIDTIVVEQESCHGKCERIEFCHFPYIVHYCEKGKESD